MAIRRNDSGDSVLRATGLLTNTFTIAGWANLRGLANGSPAHYIATIGPTDSPPDDPFRYLALAIVTSTGKLVAEQRRNDNFFSSLDVLDPLDENLWVYLVFASGDTGLTDWDVYYALDGDADLTYVGAGGGVNNTTIDGAVTFGELWNGEWFNGSLAGWKLWNHYIDPEDLALERFTVEPIFTDGLVAAWPMRDITELGADISGNDNHLTGGTGWVDDGNNPVSLTDWHYLNLNSGMEDRNGTTSHTVNFGFTPATGSFLVFVCATSAENINSEGWTERLQPSNAAELSVFTITSSGQTSITITHGASSNFPMAWTVYEFPAGTTWTDGTSASADDDTMPELSGLPGTEQFIVAAICRNISFDDGGGFTAWDLPWMEASDLNQSGVPTDGIFMTTGHRQDVTDISITPTLDITYYGSIGAQNRQKVVFALNISGGPPTSTGVYRGDGTMLQPWLKIDGNLVKLGKPLF